MSRCRITPPVHAADPPGCHQLSSRRKSAQVPPSSQPLSDAPSAPAPISPPSERSRSSSNSGTSLECWPTPAPPTVELSTTNSASVSHITPKRSRSRSGPEHLMYSGLVSEGGMQPLTHATAAAGSRYRRRPEPVPRIRLARQPASSETLAIVAKALYWWS